MNHSRLYLPLLLGMLAFSLFYVLRLGQGIYVDDIAYLMQSSRFLEENFKLWWWFPQCHDRFSLEIPRLWYAPAVIRALIGRHISSNILGMDLFAAGRATVAVLATSLIVSQTFKYAGYKTSRIQLWCSTFALLLPGTAAYYLAFLRPETTLYILLVLSLYLALLPRTNKRPGDCRFEIIIMLGQLFLYLWGISLHAQTLVFTPVFIVGVMLRVRLSVRIRTAGVAAILLIVAFSWPTFAVWGACPGSAQVSEFLDTWSVTPSDFTESLSKGFGEVWRNFLAIVGTIDMLALAESSYGMLIKNRELPNQLLLSLNAVILSTELLLLIFVSVLVARYCLLFFSRSSFVANLTSLKSLFSSKAYKAMPESITQDNANPHHRKLLGATLFFCFLVWGSMRGKHYYLVPILHGLPMLVFLLFYQRSAEGSVIEMLQAKIQRLVVIAFHAILPFSIAFNLYLFAGFSHTLDRALSEISAHKVFYRTAQLRDGDRMQRLVENCGLEAVGKQTPIVMEDATYFAVRERAPLINVLFLSDWGANSYLERIPEAWFVLTCERAKLYQVDVRARDEEICCGPRPSPQGPEK